MSERFLTAHEVADRFSLSYDAVARALREKRMPGVKILGCWRVDPRELDRWVASQESRKAPEDLLARVRERRQRVHHDAA